jgi:hypothetical protein
MKIYNLVSFVFMFNKADLIPALQSFPIISPLWCNCNMMLQPLPIKTWRIIGWIFEYAYIPKINKTVVMKQ